MSLNPLGYNRPVRLRCRILLLFLALWFPVSVVAATGMAIAMTGPAQPAVAEAEEACAMHAQQNDAERAPGDCHSCSFCQFACTALMTIVQRSLHVAGGWIEVARLQALAAAAIFDPLQRPPLAS